MEVVLKQEKGYKLFAENSLNEGVRIDASKQMGGTEAGMRPMELVLAGLLGCSSFDVLGILKKQKVEITFFEARASAKRRDEVPKIFTEIAVHFVVAGANLTEKALKRAIDLSIEKYCSVSYMLSKTAKIIATSEIKS